ncbi:MAG TPA: heme-binding domain-containing protein [Ohtaekwangia sp.]|uniref:heme-binding domain-containing protein n=1 Tax=Ohtaekwangia sp. TaxID=2066019 RepID=UPI002F91DD6F
MSTSKKIGIAVIAILVIIQFIRPAKNISEQLITANDISHTYAISEDVHQILIKKCYDCHSNNTVYPWYYNIQPVAWWMAHHVNEGKDELNFSEFKTYSQKRANHKMEELSDAVNEGWMPLDSYLWIHHEAKITETDRSAINAWIKTLPVVIEKH